LTNAIEQAARGGELKALIDAYLHFYLAAARQWVSFAKIRARGRLLEGRRLRQWTTSVVRIETLVQCSVAACHCDNVHRLANDSALTPGAICQDR
jgi:hypothetical protein